ncbi:MAG TPA: DMT family transporter [Acidimicrobiia bacterium]|nr:DMT family transporter [Acidimicrobiia bacterium]
MNPWTPLVLAMLGWGSAAVLTRAALTSGVSSFTVVATRFGIASITLVLVSRGWARFRPLGRRQWTRGALLGVIALIAPNTLFTLGLEDLPVNIGGLLIALIPIATVGAAIGGALTRRFALELGGVILTERSSRHVPVPGADIAE